MISKRGRSGGRTPARSPNDAFNNKLVSNGAKGSLNNRAGARVLCSDGWFQEASMIAALHGEYKIDLYYTKTGTP